MKKMQKVTVRRARSAQHEPGVLIPLDAEVVDVSLDTSEEHGQVVYYLREEVEVDDEPEAA